MANRITRFLTAALVASTALGGCAGAGNIGNVLGDILGGAGQQQGQSGQVSGTVLGVDARAQAIGIQQSNGQQVNLLFDGNTRVMYQNQNYPPTALERGDRVTARVQQVQQGYYTDYVQVDQSVSSQSSGSTGSLQQLQGTVQEVDTRNGLFLVDIQGAGRVTVSMPYNASRTDVQRFQSLRRGDYVRFQGVFVNNTRVDLRQFY